jgi:hypothetical protein
MLGITRHHVVFGLPLLSVAQAFLPVPQVTTTRPRDAWQPTRYRSFLFAVPYVVPLLNDCHPERREGSAVSPLPHVPLASGRRLLVLLLYLLPCSAGILPALFEFRPCLDLE